MESISAVQISSKQTNKKKEKAKRYKAPFISKLLAASRNWKALLGRKTHHLLALVGVPRTRVKHLPSNRFIFHGRLKRTFQGYLLPPTAQPRYYRRTRRAALGCSEGIPGAHPSSPGDVGVQRVSRNSLCCHSAFCSPEERTDVGNSDHFSKVSAFLWLFGGWDGGQQREEWGLGWQGGSKVHSGCVWGVSSTSGCSRMVISLFPLAIQGVKLSTEL